MSGIENKPGEETGGERARGEAARAAAGPSSGRTPGVIDEELEAQAESELEEGKPSGARRVAETDEERIARQRGEPGPGDVTDRVSEAERRAGEAKSERRG